MDPYRFALRIRKKQTNGCSDLHTYDAGQMQCSAQTIIKALEGALEVMYKEVGSSGGPTLICALCGSPMKLLTGKYGQFYGCTGWRFGCKYKLNKKGDPTEQSKELLRKKSKKTAGVTQSKPVNELAEVLDNIELE